MIQRTIRDADLHNAMELLGITGNPKEVVMFQVEHNRISVLRQHLVDGKPHMENDRIVLTSEDIRIVP